MPSGVILRVKASRASALAAAIRESASRSEGIVMVT
jgi:hypothetical protein